MITRIFSFILGIVEFLIPNLRNIPLVSPAVMLVIVNLIPVAGVLFFDWSASLLVFMYWVENVVIGFYHVLRMLITTGYGTVSAGSPGQAVFPLLLGLFVTVFFTIHYGGFTAGHGVFVGIACIIGFMMEQKVPVNMIVGTEESKQKAALSLEQSKALENENLTQAEVKNLMEAGQGNLDAVSRMIEDQLLESLLPTDFLANPMAVLDSEAFFAVLIFISHGFSFIAYFVLRREYREHAPIEMMMAPYKRIIRLHVAIFIMVFGFIAVAAILGNGSVAVQLIVFLLIFIKTILDLKAHVKEHSEIPS